MKRNFFLYIYLCMAIGCSSGIYGAQQLWSRLYQRTFSPQEQLDNGKQKTIIFSKEEILPFTQLIFSWNAFRPQQGFFSFWIQVHDNRTKTWGQWHKMMAWGCKLQCSYKSSRYVHVRFETGLKNPSQSFRIRIISHKGADLSNIKSIAVAASDFNQFVSERIDAQGLALSSFMLNNVPKKSQHLVSHPQNNVLCSPTSCSMLISYLMGKDVDPAHFAEKSFDEGLNAYGSWPFNMAHAFECCEGKILFVTGRLASFYHLYKRLQKGIPVVVSVRGFLDGAPKSYDNGHLLVVVGFDAATQQVICHDPAFADNEQVLRDYPIKSFLAAWERSHRLAYLAEPVES